MRWSPHVTVAAIIVDEEGRHLLVEESPQGSHVFNQPAGHLEPAETLLEAVCREVLEETCRIFTPQGLVGVYQWVAPGGQSYLRFCFVGRVGERLADCQLDPDIRNTRWVTSTELEQGRFPLRSPMVLNCVRDYLAGQRMPLEGLRELA